MLEQGDNGRSAPQGGSIGVSILVPIDYLTCDKVALSDLQQFCGFGIEFIGDTHAPKDTQLIQQEIRVTIIADADKTYQAPYYIPRSS